MSAAAKEFAMSVFDSNDDNRISRDDFDILVEQAASIAGISPVDLQVLNQSIGTMCDAITMTNGSYQLLVRRISFQSP